MRHEPPWYEFDQLPWLELTVSIETSMAAFSFPTFVIVIATQAIFLAIVIALVRRRLETVALAGFCISVALYALYHFALGSLPEIVRAFLRPLFANETLPGALLLLFVSSALFERSTRLARLTFCVPAIELALRYALLFRPDTAQLAFAGVFVLIGQVYIFILSGYAIWLAFRHRQSYLMETSENRLNAVYAFISPAVVVFVINIALFSVDMFFPTISPTTAHLFFTSILLLALLWPIGSFLVPTTPYFKASSYLPATAVEALAPEVSLVDEPTCSDEQDWRRLNDMMQEQTLFLDAELTLVSLAKAFGTNRANLSRLINTHGGLNFTRFVNNFRVAHAKTLLSTTDRAILDVAFESGFSAKATFNRLFKEIEGCTPTEFRDARNSVA